MSPATVPVRSGRPGCAELDGLLRQPRAEPPDRLAAFSAPSAGSADEAQVSRQGLLDLLTCSPGPLHSEWIVAGCPVKIEAFEASSTSRDSLMPSGSVLTVSLSRQLLPPYPRFTEEDAAAARAFLGD